MIRYYSIDEFNKDIYLLADRIPRGKYKGIYGIPRGGIIVALALSPILNLPVVDEANNEFILVVDDLIDSGATRNRYSDNDIAVIHLKEGSGTPVNYFVSKKDPKEWIEYWWEQEEKPAEDAVIRLIQMIGEDPKREGLKETPKRVIASYKFLFSGYEKEPESVIKVFSSDGYDQIVLLRDIEMYSMCEHHMLPFFGKAHVAYIPDNKVIGISKLARLVDMYARRLQIQERLGEQVTQALVNQLQPIGAACIIEAEHLCMRMRGVEKQNSIMVTSSLKGAFLDKPSAREELMNLINR